MATQVAEGDSDDVGTAVELLKEATEHESSVLATVQNMLKRAKNDEFTNPKGVSFLDVKCQSLLSYIINLTYVIMRKMTGKKLENELAVKRLVELRVVLEKMRPINERLKYQINKLLETLNTGNVDAQDPLRFKANPDNLATKDGNIDDDKSMEEDEDDVEEADSAKHKKASQVYVPPKISAAYYDGEDTLEARKKMILARAQKRALSSNMLKELRREYDTGPEEIKETVDPHREKLVEELKERTRYEEEYMLRLPLTKKQRHDARQVTTVTNFNTKFEDISALELGVDDMSLKKKTSGKRPKQWKGKGKKKGFKKRKRN